MCERCKTYVRPKNKHRALFDAIVEQGPKAKMSKALKKVGYKTSQPLKAKGFQEYLTDKWPDELLAERHLKWINDDKNPTNSLNAIMGAWKLKGRLRDQQDITIKDATITWKPPITEK